MGRVGIAFMVFCAMYLALNAAAPRTLWRIVPETGAMVTGIWLVIRFLRFAANHAVWRLRNRLLVTYLFIAVVPIVLIIMLAAAGSEFLVQQIAIYLVTSELDRRVENLRAATQSVEQAAFADRPGVVRGMIDLFYRERYPGIQVWSGREAERSVIPIQTRRLRPACCGEIRRDCWRAAGHFICGRITGRRRAISRSRLR